MSQSIDPVEPISAQRSPGSRYIVQSVDKALRLLEFIAEAPPTGVSLSEASAALGTSKSTVFSIFRTLELRGFVREDPVSHRFQLGVTLLWLGDTTQQRSILVSLARNVIQDLTSVTGLTSRLAIADNGYPLFLDRVDAPGMVQFVTTLGNREFPHASAAGKAILSCLDDVEVRRVLEASGMPARTEKTITTVRGFLRDLALTRKRGYALDDEEDAIGVYCVGAAFIDRGGKGAGAISVTGIKQGVSEKRIEELGRMVREHADRISARLVGN